MSNGYAPYEPAGPALSFLGTAGKGGAAGGWLSNLGSTLMGPAGLPISMGLNLVTGILGGIMEGARKKKIKKSYEKQQKGYQGKAESLFPEMKMGEFQYQNPQNNPQIQAALNSRMSNFGGWGMPPQTGVPSYAGGGIAYQPQLARIGERGPEAIIPLGNYGQQGMGGGMQQGMGQFNPQMSGQYGPGGPQQQAAPNPWMQNMLGQLNQLGLGMLGQQASMQKPKLPKGQQRPRVRPSGGAGRGGGSII